MKRFYIAVFMSVMLLCGTASAEDTASGSVVTQREKGLIDWTNGCIESRGTGVAPAGAKGAQAKTLAMRAAVLDLQRNLLEFMVGVQVDARTTMEDFMANDVVRSEVHGIIKNMETLGGEWDGESYTIKGRIFTGEIRRAIVPSLPPAPKNYPVVGAKTDAKPGGEKKASPAKAPKAKKQRWTGLVLDVRHLPYVPAMTFRVYDEKGRAVYGMEFAEQKNYLKSGLCSYFTNISYATGDAGVADNPIIAKAVRLGDGNVDIFISDADADKIRNSSYDFRKECKVIVVSK